MRSNIEVDFRATKATLAMDALRCKSAPMIEKEFAAIATLKLPHRPDRIEPRAKKRQPKNLPILTVPRQVARDIILAQRQLNRVTWHARRYDFPLDF